MENVLYNKKRKKLAKEGGIIAQHRGKEKVLFIIVFIIFAIHSFTLIFPLLWMIMSSFKGGNEYFISNPFSFPEVWQWKNYADSLKSLNVGQISFTGMIFNSLWYTALATFLAVFMPAIPGYVLSKYNFKGKEVMYSVIIFSLTVPLVGSMASSMKLINDLGLYDTPLYVLICGSSGFGSTFLIYYGFFKSVSWSYAEAAMIDGANPYTVFFKIMLPHATPIMFTYAITLSITYWNAYESIILYLPSWHTLASGLFMYKENAARLNYPMYYSGLIISMIPTIIIFCIFSSKIMTSVSVGGLKG